MNENLTNYYTVNAKNDVYKIYKNKKTYYSIKQSLLVMNLSLYFCIKALLLLYLFHTIYILYL